MRVSYGLVKLYEASQVALVVKDPPASAGDLRDLNSILGLGRSPGRGHGNPVHKEPPRYMALCDLESELILIFFLCVYDLKKNTTMLNC